MARGVLPRIGARKPLALQAGRPVSSGLIVSAFPNAYGGKDGRALSRCRTRRLSHGREAQLIFVCLPLIVGPIAARIRRGPTSARDEGFGAYGEGAMPSVAVFNRRLPRAILLLAPRRPGLRQVLSILPCTP